MTAIGTGGRHYAKAFVEDEHFPFPVLLDEHGDAAAAVQTGKIGATTLLRRSSVVSAARALTAGYRQHRTGARPMQLGATLVVGPGDELLFEDREKYPGDHADLTAVLRALRA